MKKYAAAMGVVFGFAVSAFALPQDKVVPSPDASVENDSSWCDFEGNLVTNCGFETGTLAGWTQFGDTGFTGVSGAAAHTGNFGLFAGPVGTLGGIRQNLATTPGQTYALTFYLRNTGAPNSFRASWNGSVIYSCDNCGDFPYTVYGISGLTATSSSTELSFSFYNVPDFFNFDDVIVVECDQ